MVKRYVLNVSLGEKNFPLGQLEYFVEDTRSFSQFGYQQSWLDRPDAFSISPELGLIAGAQIRKPALDDDSSLFLALADTLPGPWARSVIERQYKRTFGQNWDFHTPDEVQYLCGVPEADRMGALRVANTTHGTLRLKAASPATVDDLQKAISAAWAFQKGSELTPDLDFLWCHASSMGGTRPAIVFQESDGAWAVAKLPFLGESSHVLTDEVFAAELAVSAGIRAVKVRTLAIDKGTIVAVMQRFDRGGNGRIPAITAVTLLQAHDGEAVGYLDLLRAMRCWCPDFAGDARELWRRLVFSVLLDTTDGNMNNMFFSYAKNGFWKLAPCIAFEQQPVQSRGRRLPMHRGEKPIASLDVLLAHASAFELRPDEAKAVLQSVAVAVKNWREIASAKSGTLGGPAMERRKLWLETERLVTALQLAE